MAENPKEPREQKAEEPKQKAEGAFTKSKERLYGKLVEKGKLTTRKMDIIIGIAVAALIIVVIIGMLQ